MTVEIKKTIRPGHYHIIYAIFDEDMVLVKTYTQDFYWEE